MTKNETNQANRTSNGHALEREIGALRRAR